MHYDTRRLPDTCRKLADAMWHLPHPQVVGFDAVVQFNVLGEITVDGATPAQPQVRHLLAILLAYRNKAVTPTAIANAIWDGVPPKAEKSALQSKVSRLRQLTGERLEFRSDGYVLRVHTGECDADEFEQLANTLLGGTDPAATALHVAESALALWTGTAFVGLRDAALVFAAGARLDTLRRAVVDARLSLLVELGRFDEAIAESAVVLDTDPFRDRAVAARLVGLSRRGQRVEAIREYQSYRERLIDATGLSPSPELIAVERQLIDASDPIPAPRARMAPSNIDGTTTWSWPVVPPATPHIIVGRDHERRVLSDALADALGGHARFVILDGDAGIGKSALLSDLASLATLRGVVPHLTRGLPDRNDGFGGLAGLRGFATTIASLQQDETESPNDEVGQANHHHLDGAQARRTRRAVDVCDEILSAAQRAPVVILADEAHHFDDLSIDVLELLNSAIADQRDELPLLVVITHRPIPDTDRSASRFARLRRAPSICVTLTGLDEAALAMCISHAVGVYPAPALLRAIDHGSGNPLLAITTLQSLAATGALARAGDRLVARDRSTTRVPPDLREIAETLLANAPNKLAAGLRRLALLGSGLPREIYRIANGWTLEEFDDILICGETHGVLDDGTQHLAFRHELIRWVLAHSLSATDRKRAQLAMARNLAPHVSDEDGLAVRTVARLLREAAPDEHDPMVTHWCTLAGDNALSEALWGEAATHYEHALATLADPHIAPLLQLRAGLALAYCEDVLPACGHFEAALPSLEDDLENYGLGALTFLIIAHGLSGDRELVALAQSFVELFLNVADRNGVCFALRARCLARRAEMIAEQSVNSVSGFGLIAQAEELVKFEPLPVAVSHCDLARAIVELESFALTAAIDAYTRALKSVAATSKDPWMLAAVHARRGLTRQIAGTPAAANDDLATARSLSERGRCWSELAATEAFAAAGYVIGSDLEAASRSASRSLTAFERSGYRIAAVLTYPTLVTIDALQHDERSMRRHIDAWRAEGIPGVSRADRLKALLFDAPTDRGAPHPLRPPVGFSGLSAFALDFTAAIIIDDLETMAGCVQHVERLATFGVESSIGWVVNFADLVSVAQARIDDIPIEQLHHNGLAAAAANHFIRNQ